MRTGPNAPCEQWVTGKHCEPVNGLSTGGPRNRTPSPLFVTLMQMVTVAPTERTRPAVARLGRLLSSAPRAWTREEIIAATSDHTLTAALKSGIAVLAAPGLYVSSQHLTHPGALVDVASKWAAPLAAVGGAAALWVHGLTQTPPARVMVIAPHHFKRAPLPFTVVARFTIEIAHQQCGEVTTVPPSDAVIQAWIELEPARRVGTTLDAMRAGRLGAALVGQRLAEYPRVRGRSGLARVLAEFGDGATSFLEYRARTQVFRGPDFRDFEWQASVKVRGRRYVLDMFHRAALLAIELDGRAYHGDNDARLRDIERDAHLATVGIATLRLTYNDVTRRPGWCRSTILLAVRARTGRSLAIIDPERGESPPAGWRSA